MAEMKLLKEAVMDILYIRLIKLTLILLTWTKWWAPASASKWRMGFNSAFKGLTGRRQVS
jgi:hypothetical protein